MCIHVRAVCVRSESWHLHPSVDDFLHCTWLRECLILWFCCATELGFSEDIGAKEVFLLLLLLSSMNNVTDNAKNNFRDPLDAMYIACARSVSENVGLLLKNSYVVSYKFELVLFLGNAFVPR